MSIQENLKSIHNRAQAASNRSEKAASDLHILAVSKTKPCSDILEAYEAGVREFGENYVQEIVDKYDQLPKDIKWHMIGHLQRNKVKYIIDKVVMIHSVDSIRLAEQISSEAVKHQLSMDILLEINVANEESKFGFRLDEAESAVKEISKLPGVCIRGFMTSAPYTENAESNRQYFCSLRELWIDLKSKNYDNVVMDFLSMGMTGDFEVAIEEGATHIRVGTAIFGARDYSR